MTINTGSTSTKIAVYDDETELFAESIAHGAETLASFPTVQSQLGFRESEILRELLRRGVQLREISAFSGRGGGLASCEGGVYEVTELLFDHASRGINGTHPAQLSPQIAKRFADAYGGRAFVVDPPDTDEFDEVSRAAGLRGVYRESHVHALNQKAAARDFCAANGLRYEDANLVVAHLGGGISVTAHGKGRMTDSNDIIRGTGPMTPTRAGELPYAAVLDLAFSGEYDKKTLKDRLNRLGGLTDVFGTSDFRKVWRLAREGDRRAEFYCAGMAYQVAKHIGAMAVALRGEVDAIILTGGIANERGFTALIEERAGWIARVAVLPGEFETQALALGALRVLRDEETPKEYTGQPVWVAGF
jgi:butyrate kinase